MASATPTAAFVDRDRTTMPSGAVFDLLAPDSWDGNLSDIGHCLGQICRWAGRTVGFWSIASHSVLVHDLVFLDTPDEWELRLAALCHDAHEAFVGDAVTWASP